MSGSQRQHLEQLVGALPVPALLVAEREVIGANSRALELLAIDERKQSLNEFLRLGGLFEKIASSTAGIVTITSAESEFLQASISDEPLQIGGKSIRVVVLSSIGTRASRDARRDHRAIDVCEVGVYEHDYVSGDFYGSPLFREMYGFGKDQELTLEAFGSVFHPEDRERVIGEILASRDPAGDGIFDSLIRIVRPDGEVRWIQSRAQTEFGQIDGERHPLFCTGSTMDVTERMTLAHALELSEERYARALQESSIGVFDYEHLGPDGGKRAYWSPTLIALGELPEDISPSLEQYLAIVLPADRPLVEAAVRDSSDPHGSGRFEVEHRITARSGRVLWCRSTAQTYFREVSGQRVPVRTIGVVFDITESKKKEVEWARSSAILDATPDLVSITDLVGNPTYVNQAWRDFLSLPESELPTAERLRAVHPASAFERTEEELTLKALRDGSAKIETEYLNDSGRSVPMSVVVVAHRGPDGTVEHLSSIARDLSREKDLERRFLQAQKMEAVGRLAGGIAHDFNNMLSVITGFASIASRNLSNEAQAKRSLDEVLRAADRASELTSQLLTFSTKQIRKPKIFSLNDTIEGLKPMVARLLDESISFEFRPCSPEPFVKADPNQLEQVVLNLAVNARDAMPEGGRLIMETRLSEIDSGPHTMGHRWVTIAVSDTGCGMDAATMERIFEPFFSTKGPGKGTGLGLATVFGIVQQSGGDISVRSRVGQGTTIEIQLPCTEEAPTSEQLPQAPMHQEVSPAVILLVEDDSSLRSMVATCLRQAGHSVLVASNPNDAIAMAAQHEDELDLLLTDVVMPHMNGKELSVRVLQQAPRARVLFMSGYAEDAIVHRGVLERDVNFLAKPFTPEQLVGAVETLLCGNSE